MPRGYPTIHLEHPIFNMKFFAKSQHRRNTARVVLLVWLFALVSGVANACLLEVPGQHAEQSAGAAVRTVLTSSPVASFVDTGNDHNEGSEAGKESCLKVCDEGAKIVPTVHATGDHASPGLSLWTVTLWTGSPQLVSASRHVMDAAIPIIRLPLRVRYARLAL